MYIWIVLSFVVVAFDQLAKYLVVRNINTSDTINVIDGIIEFVFVKNTGGAFSILNNVTWLLTLISIAFCVGVIVYFVKNKPKNKWECTALSLMFAGALGNAIDRLFLGYVVDFIKTTFIDFPVFNIADIAITSGAIMLVIYIALLDKKSKSH